MTPKDKAEDLVNKILLVQKHQVNFGKAKECALIAVDEILNLIDGFDLELTFNYYLEVKQEIEKL